MFKKIVLISAALIFAGGILAASVFRASTQTLRAESMEFEIEGADENLATNEPEVATEAEESVDYALTWPGILPDHFLYPVKMIRDRIWLSLTSDPLRKSELLLRLADKRIFSAKMLIEKEKADLGVETATKAEKYLERAIEQEKLAREKGKDTVSLLQKLSLATQKHEEVLLEIREKVSDTAETIIDEALKYPRQGYEEVRVRLGE